MSPPLPMPVWHKRLADINLSLQNDKLIDKYIASGFHIYKSSWVDLRRALGYTFPRLYSSTRLYTANQERFKIDQIIQFWEHKDPLIPAMLILVNNQLVPADGKHRLKVASLADPQEIYFILFNIDYPTIATFFTPELVD